METVAADDNRSGCVNAKRPGGPQSHFVGRIVQVSSQEHSYSSMHEKNSPQRALVWGEKKGNVSPTHLPWPSTSQDISIKTD